MNSGVWDHKASIDQLNQGKELLNQLKSHLHPSSPDGGVLIEKIHSSLDKAIFMMNYNDEVKAESQQIVSAAAVRRSPKSDDLEGTDVHRMRRMLPRWTDQVQVSLDKGLEEPVEDGYNWRKYGQKYIHGNTYPRSYYRCTHRDARKCLARKQVQRTDDNPSMFDVTYRGKHTCGQPSHLIVPLQSPKKQDHDHKQEIKRLKQSHDMILLNFQTGHTDRTDNFDCQPLSSSSFFPVRSSVDCTKSANNIFSSTRLENNFIDSSPQSFTFPTISESKYFSPCHLSSFGSGPSIQNSESTTTFWPTSPVLDLDFALEPVELDPNFFLDTLGFLD